MTWLVCAAAVALAGCQAPMDGTSEQGLELGLQWGTTAYVKNEVLDFPADYTHRITSDHYEGKTFIQVTRGYDVTDTSDAGHEQILQLETSADSETFSTWDSLRRSQASIGGPAPEVYSVSLLFPAEASSNPEPNNGILEIDPSAADTLEVTWEYPAEDDTLNAEFPLEKVD